MKKIPVGSNVLNFNNRHDNDYWVLKEEGDPKNLSIFHEKKDDWRALVDIQNLDKYLDLWKSGSIDKILSTVRLDGKQTRLEILPLALIVWDYRVNPNLPISLDVLDCSDIIIKVIYNIFKIDDDDKNKKYKSTLGKTWYVVIWNIFAIYENTPLVNLKHWKILKKIHDRKMPYSYLEEVKKDWNKWLIEHGYETIEEYNKKASN